jgi:hypothetical protein
VGQTVTCNPQIKRAMPKLQAYERRVVLLVKA